MVKMLEIYQTLQKRTEESITGKPLTSLTIGNRPLFGSWLMEGIPSALMLIHNGSSTISRRLHLATPFKSVRGPIPREITPC